jgi:hypothetical protein
MRLFLILVEKPNFLLFSPLPWADGNVMQPIIADK